MPSSLFISHVYEDRNASDSIRDWAAQGLLGPGVVVTGERRDVRQGGDPAIRAELGAMIQGAAAVIVLVGSDTHNRSWVDYEVNYALSQRRKVVVVRIPRTTGAAPTSVRSLPITAFEPGALRRALGN